ncbi:MGMT family protein [Sediminicoccus sp. KRV36]|uniref:MGMT family protein n=1 Tax=Sediminicoccus sp. KRV36 TaxID=3133721 RepID=UPI00200C9D84|nr:MGMT family protein [Sediminicoccus rosea]UPY38134.1 MGMT family protein [Sediminicoccus rosea]
MAKSPFFARIKADVLSIVANIPEGEVVTFRDIGAHLDVMPRHVAYILKMLDAEERAAFPAGRVVASDAAALDVARLPHGVPRQSGPANAPIARK